MRILYETINEQKIKEEENSHQKIELNFEIIPVIQKSTSMHRPSKITKDNKENRLKSSQRKSNSINK